MKLNFSISLLILFCLFHISLYAEPKIELGVDVFFKESHVLSLKGKKIGVITNHTGMSSDLRSTIDLFMSHADTCGYEIAAFFAPEHGINGSAYAFENVQDSKHSTGIPIYSLMGKTRRPSEKMLQGIDILIYDVQDIGSRSYTYATTLFYIMEEAAKKGISVIVLDRPNPINGKIVDGPMLHDNWRSFIGYVNVPYCHGMTIGELAQLFNDEYDIECDLKVIPMKGWRRNMSFQDTGLTWIPTSPYIPEADTPVFYATTGILGELGIVNTGIGYTRPFKIIGAPWIKAKEFAEALNGQNFPGVKFVPFYFRPFYGPYKSTDCQGVLIVVTDSQRYRPLAVQYLLMGMLKSLYPKQVKNKLASLEDRKKILFCKANGNEDILTLLKTEKYATWKLIQYESDERKAFMLKRQKYLLY